MGCGRRVASGITAVLQRHERAIIIEDDCLAHDSFFGFCTELLDHYADDSRIMSISGDNFHSPRRFGTASYYFSKYFHCWGWATWRRAWKYYDGAIDAWPDYRDCRDLGAQCANHGEIEYWTSIFDRVHARSIDTWDFTWLLACWMQNGLTILPNHNLVSNLGFGQSATHTQKQSPFSELPTESIGRLRHPGRVSPTFLADVRTDQIMFSRGKIRARHLLRTIRPWSHGDARAA